MALGLKALAALPEHLGSLPSTHMVCNSSSRVADIISLILKALHENGAQTHIQTKQPYTGIESKHLKILKMGKLINHFG